ncbi:MAG: SiaB family protein kinase [Verrucomicrobium sp.]|nr:SiaB family protein kinase [Verrucomicrobium sp.]
MSRFAFGAQAETLAEEQDVLIQGESMFRYYQKVRDSRIVFAFKGAMLQETLVEIGDLVRGPIAAAEGADGGAMRRLFAIVIEMTQNVLNYSHEREFLPQQGRDVGVGMIVVQQTDDQFIVSSGNMIRNDRVPVIEERCRYVNTLGPDGLRAYYSQERKKDRPADSKGAGLGFIDIAKKSQNPLTFAFVPVDADASFFSLSAKINKFNPKEVPDGSSVH